MPREARDFLLGLLPLLLQCFAPRLKRLHSVTIAPFSRFVAVLPLFGLLTGAIDFLMGAVFDGTQVCCRALPLQIRGGEPGGLVGPESFEFEGDAINHRLQAIPLLD